MIRHFDRGGSGQVRRNGREMAGPPRLRSHPALSPRGAAQISYAEFAREFDYSSEHRMAVFTGCRMGWGVCVCGACGCVWCGLWAVCVGCGLCVLVLVGCTCAVVGEWVCGGG